MTQRYAGMLRRQAGEWDKREMPVQAECARQAARHMEELQARYTRLRQAAQDTLDECIQHPLHLGDHATQEQIDDEGGDAAFVTVIAHRLRDALDAGAAHG